MACAKKGVKNIKKMEAHAEYLNAVFTLLKKAECLEISDSKRYFSDTELRLITEILSAKHEGRRLISTQLASLLGVTRSAISQIVNRLETEGVVRRVADEVDRKIAYIEVTEKMLATYEKGIQGCLDFIGKVVEQYGKEKFYTMCDLFSEFIGIVEDGKKACANKKK